MTDDVNTEDYRNAPSGLGPLAAEWKDKPHRLLYDLAKHIDGEDARSAAAVAAAREECVAFVRQSGNLSRRSDGSPAEALWNVASSMERVDADGKPHRPLADRIAKLEAVLDGYGARDMASLSKKLKEVMAERDALRDRPPTREELEYARAMVLLKQRHEDPLGDDLSDHVYRLVAQVEVARAVCERLRLDASHTSAVDIAREVVATEVLAAMDGAANKACQTNDSQV